MSFIFGFGILFFVLQYVCCRCVGRGTAKSEIILFMSVQFDIHAFALTLLYAFSCIYWPARYS